MAVHPKPDLPDADRAAPAGVVASVIVLAYDSADTLGVCLQALTGQVEDLEAELLVVDNASRDRSAEVGRRAGARVLRSQVNRGFAGGCNLGVRASRGEVVVLVNPDTNLDPGALRVLVETAAHGPVGPVGGRAHHDDGTFDQRCVMGRPLLRGALAFALGVDTMLRGSRWFDPEHGPVNVEVDVGVVPVDAVSGAVMAIRRDLWDELGGLDERYFVYGEDVDLCLRAAAAGRQPVVATAAGYHHVGGMAVDATIRRRVLLHRGKVELYRCHLATPAAALAVACLQVGALLRGLPALLPDNPASDRARPWLDLFRRRGSWRRGHVGAPPPEMAA